MIKTATIFLSLCSLDLAPKAFAFAFGPSNPTARCVSPVSFSCISMTSMDDSNSNIDNDENDDSDDANNESVAQPMSRMTDYATQFLDRTSSQEDADDGTSDDQIDAAARIEELTMENISDATHLIAIPMESNYELLIELESVQRAILHHCPILLDACIYATTTRLPLLYIQAPGASQNEDPQKSTSVTIALAKTVQRLVKKHIFGAGSRDSSEENSDDEEELYNTEGYRPLAMTFQSLEIDGDNNNILNTVGTFSEGDDAGDKDYNEKRFENLIQDLQSAIASQGWKMAFPPDPNRTDNENKINVKSFRPRVAFMELPAGFDENISKFKRDDTEIKEEDMKFLRAEEGGNGISPIFWSNWWDDVFARNVRLQDIGIYPRSSGPDDKENAGLKTNSQFFIPFESIALPNGNTAMLKTEKKFSKYHEDRLREEEEKFRKENFENQEVTASELEPESESPQESQSPLSSTSSKSSEPDILMSKTRKRLESIYLNSENGNSDTLIEDVDESYIDEIKNSFQDDEDIIDVFDTTDKVRSQEDDYIEDWMRDRIMKAQSKSPTDDEEDVSDTTEDHKKETDPISPEKYDSYAEDWMMEKVKKTVSSMGSLKNRNVEYVEPEFSIEDNPVFKSYKKGTLTADQPKVSPPPPKKLGPYPGNDHFIGIWKVMTNPMGDGVGNNIEEGSENLLLRVDGTTAAGPTLNPETNQKAAGGTWKMIEQENGDVLLRIRLVVPPEKNRIVVMEGLVERGSELAINMPSRNFGIPQLEEMEKEASKNKKDILTCSGEAHIEDAVTKKNIVRAEHFSLMKVQGVLDPSEYTITVPKTIRRLD